MNILTILDIVSANVEKASILGNTCDCNGKRQRIYDIKETRHRNTTATTSLCSKRWCGPWRDINK